MAKKKAKQIDDEIGLFEKSEGVFLIVLITNIIVTKIFRNETN